MIVHFNQSLQTTRTGSQGSQTFAELSGRVVESLATLMQQGHIDEQLLSTLRIHLDWIQYRANFRDPVSVRRAVDAQARLLPLAEIAIDLRQIDAERLTPLLADAYKALRKRPAADGENDPVAIDDFRPMRDGLIWQFNRLFWQRLTDWEAASGRGFEVALPSSGSDANHPKAIADAVGDFWTLLRDLEARGQLPEEVIALEIGVGSGARARLWLDRFKALDEQTGTT